MRALRACCQTELQTLDSMTLGLVQLATALCRCGCAMWETCLCQQVLVDVQSLISLTPSRGC